MDKEWVGTTYGNGWMHKWLIRILKHTDVRIWYAFASVFVVPVCLILNPSYGIAYRYFRNRHGLSSIKAFWLTYVNHCLFSQVVIDKFAMYSGKKFKIELEGYEYYTKLNETDKGFIIMSSHIGNYEIAGYTLVAENKPFNALVFYGEKESVMNNRNKMFADTNIRMIPIKNDMSHLFVINNALQNGEIVSMPADRILGSKKSISKVFLGATADFPMGPFSIATMRGLDVLAVNVMKVSLKSYKIYITPLAYDKSASRKEQIEELSEKYKGELERMIKKYPAQWYNFYEFWASSSSVCGYKS